ncbi:MAG: DUF423 domain-containing protein [SAR324 cluster bacterium]|nr:DUF423 domain-containing protein [SAR324 cluster bacterium]
MLQSSKIFALLGSINAALAVILGAFGAHALKAQASPEMLAIFQTGLRYHFYHAMGLFAVAFVASQLPQSKIVKWAGWLMLGGTAFFSGGSYLLSLTGVRQFGMLNPIGGIAFILSWLLLAFAVLQKEQKS